MGLQYQMRRHMMREQERIITFYVTDIVLIILSFLPDYLVILVLSANR